MFFKLVCGLCLMIGLEALEFGNPYLPQIPEAGFWIPKDAWAGLKAGYVGEWVHDLNLEVKTPKKGFSHTVNRFETWSHLAELALNLGQRFQIYGQAGSIKAQVNQKTTRSERIQCETQSQLVGGLGARLILIEWAYAAVGVNANGLLSSMDIDELKQNGQAVRPKGSFIRYQNWQLGGNIGFFLGPFLPYIGLAYQDATAKFKKLPKLAAFDFDPHPPKLVSRRHEVLFLGTGMTLDRGFDLNLEVRMIGEIGGSIRFDLRF